VIALLVALAVALAVLPGCEEAAAGGPGDAASEAAPDVPGDVPADPAAETASDIAAEIAADAAADTPADPTSDPVAEAAPEVQADLPADASADAPGCGKPPLDPAVLDNLRISLAPMLQVQPGGVIDFEVGKVECCVYLEPVDACVTWSATPAEGASIDPVTGRFEVAAGTAPGTKYTVTADVESGRRTLSIDVHVYTPESNPLVGIWREESRVACGTGEVTEPADPIGELLFYAGGTFNVTWTPFETYVDYWGAYEFSVAAGTISFAAEGGNYVPADLDGQGTFGIDEHARLTLTDVWLGTSQQAGAGVPVACGHVFRR